MNMYAKHIIILLGLTFGVYFCTLFNQFVGDDHVLFEGNAFYTSWSHWPDLFTQKYLTPSAMEKPVKQVYHSGSVSYRPVLSLTYFFDYSIWKLNPFGYHLDNLIYHMLNTVLVYLLFNAICQNPAMALFSACLFSVHPTKVEAVACIGYRADLLACFLQLLSFLAFIVYRSKKAKRYWIGCLMTYFLALFTKESAVVLPLIYLAYDCCFKDLKISRISLSALSEYASLIVLTFFYLYIYFFVFPNTAIVLVKGGTLLHHATVMSWIFTHYFIDLTLPFLVVMLPPLYAPPIEPVALLKLLSGVLLFLFLSFAIVRFYRNDKRISFFLFVFLVGFIPIANIIPLANPMAQRFLYFPSVGFAAVIGLMVANWQNYAGKVFKMALIGLCIAYTVPLNIRWNNDVSVARTLLENYPNNIKAHLILAVQFLKAGEKREARQELRKCIQLGDRDPWINDLMKAAHE